MTIKVKVGRKKAIQVVPPPAPAYPFVGKHARTGELYLVTGVIHDGSPAPSRFHNCYMVACITAADGKRTMPREMIDPFFEPVTIQTMKERD